MEPHVDRAHRWLAYAALVLVALSVVIGVTMSFVPAPAENPEGAAGGPMFIAFMAVPLLLLALGLRSRRPRIQLLTTVGSLLFGAFLGAVVLGNWSGYSPAQRLFVPAMLGPVVVVCLLSFVAGIKPRPGHGATVG